MLAFAIIIKTLKDKHGDIKLALTFVEKGLTLGNQLLYKNISNILD
jgi:hypothetical protein